MTVIPCSPVSAAGVSAGMRSNESCGNTPRSRPRCVRHSKDKRVTPHVLRHAAAMTLLQSGVDCAVIALWLGHESLETTQIYLHADLQLKEKAMDQTKPVGVPSGRYQPPDEVMAFLEAL